MAGAARGFCCVTLLHKDVGGLIALTVPMAQPAKPLFIYGHRWLLILGYIDPVILFLVLVGEG